MDKLGSILVATFVLCVFVKSTFGDTFSYCAQVVAEDQLPKTCMDLRCLGFSNSGVYTVYPTGSKYYSFKVYCDQQTDDGGWTVFQRRMDGSVEFYRKWQSYKLGFGDIDAEHWLGNDKISQLLATHSHNELRVDLEAVDNQKAYAKYSIFNVGDESTLYKMDIGGYSGNAGDSMTSCNGMNFTTQDYDYDTHSSSNCAVSYKGAWWYSACHGSNLNGLYLNGNHTTFANGVNWHGFKGYYESLKITEMKFRARL